MNLVERMLALHSALDDGAVPHAFGGALALGWCTGQVRATIDIDLNLFVAPDAAPTVLHCLPPGVAWGQNDVARIDRDGQVRLRWDDTPVDLFFNTTDFHDGAADRATLEPIRGTQVPFLACADLAVFKAFFDRPKDWLDLSDMVRAGLDVEAVSDTVARYLGGHDHRVARLRQLAA